ncbi:MAG TPA: SDR family NAD(P)-dependent oxidoreductase [Candidatus Polarisedimenticolia bacterium]|nr:SDR family NAD(P)-dependent oxidoreductase [Candidatus Polarisedimenticolia bacterium]
MAPPPPEDDAASGPESLARGEPAAPQGRLEGRIALVTGGGSGIGRAIALLFAREGARVVVAGRRSEPLQEAVRVIRSRGGVATFARGDVTRADRVELMVQGAIYNFGGLDILVNNAGVFEEGSILQTEEKRWDRVVGTNLKGAYLVSRHAVRAMKERGGGCIINNASIHGLAGMREGAAYCASKGGLIALTRAMALDHAADRIRVNAICPGLVDTPMTRDEDGGTRWLDEAVKDYPLGRAGTPEEVARLALHLASDDASWTTGAVLTIDGGYLAR